MERIWVRVPNKNNNKVFHVSLFLPAPYASKKKRITQKEAEKGEREEG